jgi:tetratricopeptide (TPR) repeat protein
MGADSEPPQQDDIEKLLQGAFDSYQRGNFDQSLSICAKVSRLAPGDFRPHCLAGYVYIAQEKFKSASQEFEAAIRLQPRNKQLYLLKAGVDAERGEHDEAIAACRKALEIDPAYAEAHAMMGQALRWDEKRRGEAIAAYQSAIKANPRFLTCYEPLGELFDRAGDPKSAEETFKQGLAIDPKHMTCRFALGRLLIKQGRLPEAREIWNTRTSDEDDIMPSFIVVLERAENLKRATDALAQKPNDPDALVSMGLAILDGDSWVVDGRQERAIVYFKKALELKPGFARAQYGICKGYIQIAFIDREKKRIVDEELSKLKVLDAGLAKELDEYRKNYVGGIRGIPVDPNK